MGDRKKEAFDLAYQRLVKGVARDAVIGELQERGFKNEAKRATFEAIVEITFKRKDTWRGLGATWGEVKALLEQEGWPASWIRDVGFRWAGELIEREGRRGTAGIKIAKLLRNEGYGKWEIFDRLSDVAFPKEMTRRAGLIDRWIRGVRGTELRVERIYRFVALINKEGLAITPEPQPALQAKPLTVRIFGEAILALWQFSRGKSEAAEKFADRLPLDFLEWPDPEPGFFGRLWDKFEDNLPKILLGYLCAIPIIFIVSKLMGY